MKRPAPRYAGIDLGTNSIRLLVAEVREGGRLHPLLRLGESCRLGEGLDGSGTISADAEGRAAISLQTFVERARSFKPRAIAVAATHAIRSARNGEEVAERLGRAAGVPVEVLSGEEEARLVYQAVAEALAPESRNEPFLVADVGGGSVEFVRAEGGEVASWVSLALGCVRLTERFITGDPVPEAEFDALLQYLRGELDGHRGLLRGLAAGAGVGGTLTALAAIDLGLPRYEASRVEGHYLSRRAMEQWAKRLRALSNWERSGLPAVGPGRADIIVAGCAVLGAVLEATELPGLTVSTQGLRYALVRRLALAQAPAQSGRA